VFVVPGAQNKQLSNQLLHEFAHDKYQTLVRVYNPYVRRYLGQPRWQSYSNQRINRDPALRTHTLTHYLSWCNLSVAVVHVTRGYKLEKYVQGNWSLVPLTYGHLIPRKVKPCL